MANWYVQRDGGGAVIGLFANPQPGFAEEALADDHADVLAFLDPPAARKPSALSGIDRQAEEARLRFVTPGAGQAAVYVVKADEAERLGGDPSPDPAGYPLLAASIGIEAPDTGDAAADLAAVAAIVLATRDGWLTAAAAIEATRLGAKAAVAALADPPDPADVDAILAGLDWPAPGG